MAAPHAPAKKPASRKTIRKPQKRTLELREHINAIVADYDRLTIRQLYYQLVSRYGYDKTEAFYERAGTASVQMRLDGTLPYRKIVDGSRARRQPNTYSSMAETLELSSEFYRRNLWVDQPCHVEVWCEKDALSGVIQPVCDYYGVAYVAIRGFSSLTLFYESAEDIKTRGKPATIYYFGDHDASGQTISSQLEADLRGHGADVTVVRMALNPHHIEQYGLSTRPGKRTDSRYKAFAARYGDASVELDALPPDVLTRMVSSAIKQSIDQHLWAANLQIEALERQTLACFPEMARRLEPGALISLAGEG